MDSDLAMLYQVDTGALNRAVKRNKKRFPDDFCFQLTEEELLRCQNGISKKDASEGRGGRRYMPYAFTEQGISMLSAILRSDVAINVSIGIMRAFVEMRKFLATNSLILNRIDDLEVKQLQYQKSTDERFDKVFQYIEDHAESEQKVFFDGQIYDAFSLITSIIQKAQKEIILIDGYVDIDTLNILAKKNAGVARMIRFAVNDDYDTILYGGYDPTIVSSRVLEDDEITIYGTSVGLFSFLHALEPLRFYRAIERPVGARHGGHRVVA